MTPEELKDRTCNFEDCRHLNSENICCIHNQENCILYRIKKENEELKAVEKMALYSKMSDQLAKAIKHLKDLAYVVELGKNELATIRILAEAKEFLKETK
jgi:hypothetical protein